MRRHHAGPLLGRKRLRASDELFETRDRRPVTNSVRLVGPEEIPDPHGHFQPPAQLRVHKILLPEWPRARGRRPCPLQLDSLLGGPPNGAPRFAARSALCLRRARLCAHRSTRVSTPGVHILERRVFGAHEVCSACVGGDAGSAGRALRGSDDGQRPSANRRAAATEPHSPESPARRGVVAPEKKADESSKRGGRTATAEGGTSPRDIEPRFCAPRPPAVSPEARAATLEV